MGRNQKVMIYTILEHQHRFAVWTSARAVQRSFTSTKYIKQAIEATSLKNFSESSLDISLTEYQIKHKRWVKEITANLAAQNVVCSYGRAAKIIAIYLKTSVILPEKGLTKRCDIIYPPIDKILLYNLSKQADLKDFSKKIWTKFDHKTYYEVEQRIRNKFLFFNWRIEKDWF